MLFYPTIGLTQVRHGRVIQFGGGSNVLGFEEDDFAEGIEDEYPFTLPPNVIIRIGSEGGALGAALTGYPVPPDPHGPYIGFFDRLFEVGGQDLVDGSVCLVRTRNGSALADWYSGNILQDEMIADAVTAGVTPNVVVPHVPNADVSTAGLGLAAEGKYQRAFGKIVDAYGGDAALIIDGPLVEDDVGSPGNDVCRATAKKWCGHLGVGELTGRRVWVNANEDLAHLQGPLNHRNHTAMILFGRRVADVVIQYGLWN